MDQPREYNRLGEFVKQQRQAKGLTGQALAKAAGVDKGVLSRIERGETTQPSPRVLLAIARALEMDGADLYLQLGSPAGSALPSIEPYLRAKFDLPDEAVSQIAEIVDMYNERYGGKEGDDGSDRAA